MALLNGVAPSISGLLAVVIADVASTSCKLCWSTALSTSLSTISAIGTIASMLDSINWTVVSARD